VVAFGSQHGKREEEVDFHRVTSNFEEEGGGGESLCNCRGGRFIDE